MIEMPTLEQLAAQAFGEPLEKTRVVGRVAQLLFAERSARPVRLLPVFSYRDIKESLDEGGQPDLFDAEQLRRDRGVEDFTARSEAHRGAHHAQVVVTAVHDQRLLGQGFEETGQVQFGKRVDEEVLATEGELDQTDLFEIVVQTVGLGIHRYPFVPPNAPDQPFQRGGFSDVNVTLRLWLTQRFDLLHRT